MSQPLLVVARRAMNLNKFEKTSTLDAVNIKDFLEQTGEFDEVTIFQLKSADGAVKEWVALHDIEC